MGQCPVDVNPLPIGSWATAALVQLLMAALMVKEIRCHRVCMAPVLLEAPSSFTLQCCMQGKAKETLTDNKIPDGDLCGIWPPTPKSWGRCPWRAEGFDISALYPLDQRGTFTMQWKMAGWNMSPWFPSDSLGTPSRGQE